MIDNDQTTPCIPKSSLVKAALWCSSGMPEPDFTDFVHSQGSIVGARYTVPLDAVLQHQLTVECPDKGRFSVSDDIGAVVSLIQYIVNPACNIGDFICLLITDFLAMNINSSLSKKL